MQEAYQEQLKETDADAAERDDHGPPDDPQRAIARSRSSIPAGDTATPTSSSICPKERVIITGDYWEGDRTGALNFGFHDEWADNLEKLKPLDFDWVIAGHGEPFRGKDTIAHKQTFLRDLWNQAATLHAQKVPAAEAAKRIDLTAHKAHFDNFTQPGIGENVVARIYQVLEERSKTVVAR